MRTVRLPDGATVPVIGQGTWRMGEGHRPAAVEADALRLGLDLGMTLIDTAEMYGDGGSERVVAQAIAGRRDEVFLVSKVYPQNAGLRAMARSCDASLKRLGTDRLDLYLLHWRGGTPLGETVRGVRSLARGRQDPALGRVELRRGRPGGAGSGAARPPTRCCTTRRHAASSSTCCRWCARRHLPIMAYSPVGQGGGLLDHPALATVAGRHGATPAQVAIAWSVRLPGIVSIPKASDPHHVRANAAAAGLELSADDLALIDAAFAPPRRRQPLEML